MLQGKLTITDDTVRSYEMMLRGYDIAHSVNLEVVPSDVETRNWLDKGTSSAIGIELASWRKITIGVGETRIRVGLPEFEGWRSEGINESAFRAIGGILRGIKSACTNSTFVDVDGDSSLYQISGEWGSADVALSADEFVTVNAHGVCLGYKWDLRIESDPSYVDKIFPPKNCYSWGIDTSWIAPKIDKASYESLGDPDDDFYGLEQIMARHPNKKYDWLLDCDYEIIDRNSIDRVVQELKDAVARGDYIAFDTETTGLNIRFTSLRGNGDVAVGLIFSIREGQGWYVPVRMNNVQNIWDDGNTKWTWALEYDTVRGYFKDILEQGKIVGHNVSFDWKVMWLYGINTNFVDDTLLITHMGCANQHRGLPEGLKGLVSHFLNRDALELKDIAKSGNWSENNFADLPYETVRLYGCADGDDTLSLFNYYRNNHYFEMYGLDKPSYRIEVAFARVQGYQEFYGHHVDMAHVDELRRDIESGIAEWENKLYEILGRSCNLRSSKQLADALYGDLGYPVLQETKTGSPSTDKKTLDRLASVRDAEGNPKYPFASGLLEYRQWAQLRSNFVDVLDKLGTRDGFLFSSVNLPLETGRVSVKDPNYQSYNDTVKKYISPRRGYYMLDMDYSSVEYRILASMSGQTNLVETFKDPDTDYHTYQAARMFGVPYELVTPELRHQAKGINFGLPYGMGDASLGARIYGERTGENTRKAKHLRELYFEGQEKVKEFFEEKRGSALEKSYAETYFGRRRYFDRRKERDDKIMREGGNMAIQGTAADIFKLGMVNLFEALTERGWLGKFLIVAFVHDEALYEVSNDIDPIDALDLVEHCIYLDINEELKDWAPLYLGGGFGENWYHAKKTEIPIELQAKLREEYAGKWNGTGTGLTWWNGDINRLYAWEVEQNNGYYAYRVKKYLSQNGLSGPDNHMELAGQNVNPQVNTYALDMLKYLRGEDGQEYAKANGRDWVDAEGYSEWISAGGPIGDTPVEQLNNAGWVLGFGRSKASDLGLCNPELEDADSGETDSGQARVKDGVPVKVDLDFDVKPFKLSEKEVITDIDAAAEVWNAAEMAERLGVGECLEIRDRTGFALIRVRGCKDIKEFSKAAKVPGSWASAVASVCTSTAYKEELESGLLIAYGGYILFDGYETNGGSELKMPLCTRQFKTLREVYKSLRQ